MLRGKGGKERGRLYRGGGVPSGVPWALINPRDDVPTRKRKNTVRVTKTDRNWRRAAEGVIEGLDNKIWTRSGTGRLLGCCEQ